MLKGVIHDAIPNLLLTTSPLGQHNKHALHVAYIYIYIERERSYYIYIEREREKGTSWNPRNPDPELEGV